MGGTVLDALVEFRAEVLYGVDVVEVSDTIARIVALSIRRMRERGNCVFTITFKACVRAWQVIDSLAREIVTTVFREHPKDAARESATHAQRATLFVLTVNSRRCSTCDPGLGIWRGVASSCWLSCRTPCCSRCETPRCTCVCLLETVALPRWSHRPRARIVERTPPSFHGRRQTTIRMLIDSKKKGINVTGTRASCVASRKRTHHVEPVLAGLSFDIPYEPTVGGSVGGSCGGL